MGFIEKEIVDKLFTSIPKEILPFAAAAENAIIYFEASKLWKKVAIVPNALWHQEPEGLYNSGVKIIVTVNRARLLVKTGHYSSLLSKKIRLRDSTRSSRDKVLSSPLLSLKGPAYLLGFYFR